MIKELQKIVLDFISNPSVSTVQEAMTDRAINIQFNLNKENICLDIRRKTWYNQKEIIQEVISTIENDFTRVDMMGDFIVKKLQRINEDTILIFTDYFALKANTKLSRIEEMNIPLFTIRSMGFGMVTSGIVHRYHKIKLPLILFKEELLCNPSDIVEYLI